MVSAVQLVPVETIQNVLLAGIALTLEMATFVFHLVTVVFVLQVMSALVDSVSLHSSVMMVKGARVSALQDGLVHLKVSDAQIVL